MKRAQTLMMAPLLMLAVLAVGACANMGRPEGGPRDETPPVFVRSDPAPGAVNVTATRLHAYFDENIQLEDAFDKVVVSPAMKTPPQVTANGRHLTVEFRDTLRDSTTYTVDFADAIKDLNEGNILDGFALDFSTGPVIDTLRISGMVLAAENLEPAQGMLVGVYSNLADSAIRTLPLDRIARTNQYGQFTIRNLPPGEYRVFAINDVNRDYHWDRSEDVAFLPGTVSPSTEAIVVTDTLFAADRSDSLVMRQGIRYLPNDLFLSWFNEGYKASYLQDYKRPERRRITIDFAAPQDSATEIRIVDGAPGAGRLADDWALARISERRDSIELWLADTTVLAADSLRLSVRYLKTDTADQLVWTTDTLRFFFKDRVDKEKEKQEKQRQKQLDKLRELAAEGDSVAADSLARLESVVVVPEFLAIRSLNSGRQDLNKPMYLESTVPWTGLDSAGVHMEVLQDTLWMPVAGVRLVPDSANLLMRRRIDLPWVHGAKYRLTIDSLAATSLYGTWNRPLKEEFTVTEPEDYANLTFTIPGTDSLQLVVELLNASDEPAVRAVKPVGTDRLVFRYLPPASYYARLIVDRNANGRWDTGSIADSIQPEDVYYFSRKLNLRKNWDVEQTWLIDELPVDLQKPYAIKKNKPKLKRGEQAPDQEEEESWEDRQAEFEDPFTPRRGSNRNNNSGNSNNSGNGRFRRNNPR